MTATYIPTSQIANDPAGILWLEKREGQTGKTSIEDIQDALEEYKNNFNAGNISKAEILTLHRAFPDSPTYKQAAVGIQKMDMVDPLVIGGPASVEMIDREGHLITTGALNKAFKKFMDNQRTRNVMVLHSDVQVGWALPAYISKGGQIFKSGVGDNGLFFICELRDDTAIAKKVADQINQGMLKSYSIAGSATKIQNMKKGETPYMQVDEMELAEVTICEKGVNQGASFELLKAELPQTGKIDKDQCGYRDATAPEEKLGINCGHCKYFNSETRTCDVVVGDIMPGDYCRLFEQTEEQQPKAIVHRKIVIMHKDDTGRINFKDSFMGWMEKEKQGEDPLKSGKSFATLNNFAGREAEHHRLLEEYGFPSEPDIETMRYIPVVETETDDDGKPINIIPPWVVNEAAQDLGDKLDNDEIISVNKAMDIFDEILQKANPRRPGRSTTPSNKRRFQNVPAKFGKFRSPQDRGRKNPLTTPGKQTQAAEERITPIGDPTQIQRPIREAIDKANGTPNPVPQEDSKKFQESMGVGQMPQVKPDASTYGARPGTNTPGPVPVQPKPQGRDAAGLGQDYGPQPAKFRGERQFTPAPEKRPGLLQRLGNQIGGRGEGTSTPAPSQGRDAEGLRRDYPSPGIRARGAEAGKKVLASGRRAMDRGRERMGAGAKRMGELFGAGARRAKAGAQEAKRIGAGIGRDVKETAGIARGKIAEGGRRAIAGTKEFGGGLREGFGSVSGYGEGADRAPIFDEIRSGGGKRDSQGRLRRTAQGRRGQLAGNRSGARRIGQLFGATGRGTVEGARIGAQGIAEGAARGATGFAQGLTERDLGSELGERGRDPGFQGKLQRGARRLGGATRMGGVQTGRFGRGVARGATPGQAGRDWRGREQGDDAGSDRQRSASERFGQWLGGQGRERTADVLDTTGQTARGVKRGLVGKRGQEEYDRGDASAGETFGRWMGEAARGAGRNAPKVGSGARRTQQMQRDEGVGKGINFQPNAHRGASLGEQDRMVTGLTDKINAGQDMSPKEWMQVIHHMSQTPEGNQYAHFSDIDMSHGDWNKPISFSDMKQHLERMNVSHGTHGDMGKRGYRNLINKIENVTSGADREGLKLNPRKEEAEGEGPETNYNRSTNRPPPNDNREDEGRETNRRGYNRRTKEQEEEMKRQGYGPDPRELAIMNSYGGPKVMDTFKRAFKVNV